MPNSFINFFETTPTFYFFKIDLEGKYTFVNKLYNEHFGNYYINFIGKNFLKCTHENDKEQLQNVIIECIQNPEKVIEANYKKPLQENFSFVKFNFFAIRNDEGKVVEIGAIGFDTTEQAIQKISFKQTQRKLQAILESSEEAFYFLDPNLIVLSFSNGARNAAKALLGIEMHEGLDFKKEMLLPGTESDFLAQFNDALVGNGTTIESEMDFPNGRKVWYKLIMKPVYDEKSRLRGVSVSFINIDIIKKSEKSLREIAWHQSHQVRKPLSNILALVDLLADGKNKEEQHNIIAMLKSSALELDDVVKKVVSKTAIEK